MKSLVRVALAALLLAAGVAHFAIPEEFLAQVPSFLPWPTAIVYLSGVVEIALGLALLLVRGRRRLVGWVVAAFFVAVFPGNIAQWAEGRDGFGLDTDAARAIRLLLQPLLVVAALWSTGGWSAIRRRLRDRRR